MEYPRKEFSKCSKTQLCRTLQSIFGKSLIVFWIVNGWDPEAGERAIFEEKKFFCNIGSACLASIKSTWIYLKFPKQAMVAAAAEPPGEYRTIVGRACLKSSHWVSLWLQRYCSLNHLLLTWFSNLNFVKIVLDCRSEREHRPRNYFFFWASPFLKVLDLCSPNIIVLKENVKFQGRCSLF